MPELTKVQRIANALTTAVNAIDLAGLRPENLVALKSFVEPDRVELKGRTRGGKVGLLVRLDETSTEDPEELQPVLVEAMKALAAKDEG